jgi:hypothetical protein
MKIQQTGADIAIINIFNGRQFGAFFAKQTTSLKMWHHVEWYTVTASP